MAQRCLSEDEALARMGDRPSRVPEAWKVYDAAEERAWRLYCEQRDYLGGFAYLRVEADARARCERDVRRARYGARA